MKCPHNRKSETVFQRWIQQSDENQSPEKGGSMTQAVFELMECEKENCGARQNGKCCYATK